MEIQFGTKKITKVTDGEGSTKTVSVDYSQSAKPLFRVDYIVRHRVRSKDEESNIVQAFLKENNISTSRINPNISVESSSIGKQKGYYYVVTSWREIKRAAGYDDLLVIFDKL